MMTGTTTSASMTVLATIVLGGLLVGCGSSGSATDGGGAGGKGGTAGGKGGAGGGSAVSCAGSAITWKDDGTTECAPSAEAIRMFGNMSDDLEIVGTQGLTISISLLFGSNTTLGGSYDCTFSPSSVEITFRDPQDNGTLTVQNCATTLGFPQPDAGGAHTAEGTFSFTLTGDGTTKNITDGVFNLPYSVLGG